MKRMSAIALCWMMLPVSQGFAQDRIEDSCTRPEVEIAGAGEACVAAAQALVSGQPALGLLIAGGNPTLGTSGSAGLGLGVLSRLTLGVRLNTVAVRLPDILVEELSGDLGEFTRRFGAPVPAVIGDAAITLTNGFDASPGVGGIGALSVLGSISFLPFDMLGAEGFEGEDLAFGLGGRVHLLRESFFVPGISGSVMWRSLQRVEFGDICPSGVIQAQVPGSTQTFPACAGSGDHGEFSFDLTDVSARLVASKHLIGLGFTAGFGYDEYDSDVAFGFRGDPLAPGTPAPIFRVTSQTLESTRWSVFGSASYTLLVGTLGVEAGWQQGSSPLPGFPDLQSDFNPRSGMWFGSLGARLSL